MKLILISDKLKKLIIRVTSTSALSLALTQSAFSQINDYMFPAAPEAKKYSNYDPKGFIINSKRTFLVSAGLEYARIPHQLWHDRLLRLKRDGFNCVEIYTFWNFHEPHEGQFDFTGDHDLNAFLKEVKKLGMYAIARVGPYYCAEWDSGGYPVWLRFKDNMLVRSPNAAFEKYTDRFFDKLFPIISNNQINKGGPIILVQLENEHPLGWGTHIPNQYFQHLKDKAVSLGLTVPYFFSGLNHGEDPAGNKKLSLDETGRPNPWFTTEFWSVWYNLYNSTQKDADIYGRRTWKIIAHGGNGYNYYMAHGGTNFDYSNSNEDAASYDYGAAVGQTGDLRPIYYQFKRNALFARSFQDILENSANSDSYKGMITDTSVVLTARHSDAGDILFLDHRSAGNLNIRLPADGLTTKLTLGSGEILPVVHNFKFTNGVTLNWALTRILGITKQGNTTTMVVFGPTGSPADIKFTSIAKASVLPGSKPLNIKGNEIIVHADFDKKQPLVYVFKAKAQTIRIVALNTALADRTWFVDDKNRNYIVIGPEYVSEVNTNKAGKVSLTTEHFWEQKTCYPTWLYAEGYSKMTSADAPAIGTLPESKFISSWQAKSASAPSLPAFDDSGWKKSVKALEMGADDDNTTNVWYRTNINILTAGAYKLNVNKGGGRFIVFIDGKKKATGTLEDLQFDLTAGNHQMSVYAAHDGRDKLYNFTGNLQDIDTKGMSGDVILQLGPISLVENWKMIPAEGTQGNPIFSIPVFNTAIPYHTSVKNAGQKPGYVWYQARIPVINGRMPRFFIFRGVEEKSIVFVNGKEAARQTQPDQPLIVPYIGLDTARVVTLTVLAESRARRKGNNQEVVSGLYKPAEVVYRDDPPVTGWRMKGGPGDMSLINGWKTMASNDQFDRPYFFKNKFVIHKRSAQSHPMWRVTFEGLNHGFVFVNGHNIGGYPERIAVKSMYIPEVWLKEGANTIIVYDQYGNRPDKIQIQPETAASRDTRAVSMK